MSFEGYYQLLCKNGHLWHEQAVCFSDADDFECSEGCGKPVWWNIVDQTNGFCEKNGDCKIEHDSRECHECKDRIDGAIYLELRHISSCSECNTVLERRFKIPEDRHRVEER